MAVQQIIKSAYYLIDTQLRTGEKQTLVRVFTNIIHWEDTRKYRINDWVNWPTLQIQWVTWGPQATWTCHAKYTLSLFCTARKFCNKLQSDSSTLRRAIAVLSQSMWSQWHLVPKHHHHDITSPDIIMSHNLLLTHHDERMLTTILNEKLLFLKIRPGLWIRFKNFFVLTDSLQQR